MNNIYINRTTRERVDEQQIRQEFGFTQQHLENHHLEGTNYALVIQNEISEPEDWQLVEIDYEDLNTGYYKITYSLVENPNYTKVMAMKQRIADKRYGIEVGGIDYNGMRVPTDRNTQSILTAMNLRADRNPDYTETFKLDNGVWVEMNKELIVEIGDLVFAHVSDCFKREKELNDLLDAGEDVTEEDW